MTQHWLQWGLDASNETRMLEVITTLGAFDRYQASRGIMAAATLVSCMARERGLSEVTVHHFIADGAPCWWDFRAPQAWTPLKATLSLAQPQCVLDHQVEPFTLATYSTAACGYYPLVSPDDPTDFTGKIVLIPAADYQQAGLIERLKQGCAVGFITDAFARFDASSDRYWRGRIELSPGCGLFAFSVLPDELHSLASATTAACVEIVIDSEATMPVVTATIPGMADAREIWITAHLCHSRAGANDNASGVSASLEVAGLLRQLTETAGPLRYPVRFIWGPEFLGVVAMQYKRRHLPGPVAVINLDMVGEDPLLCGSPMCVELPPERLGSPLGQMTTALMQQVFALTAAHPGGWLTMPFQGFSDHALFMNHCEAHHNAPAVQLCHIDDRFNHTAADLPDKVSVIEMKRTVAVTLALIMQLQQLRPDEMMPHGDRPTYKAGGIIGRWAGPLNLRELIRQLENPLRQQVEALIARDKRYLALLHHCAINADGRSQRSLLQVSASTTGLTLSEAETALLSAVFAASDYFQVCTTGHAPEGTSSGSTTTF